MTERVGFIGLGIMGRPMARNLLRAGSSLVVHNRSPQAVHELVAEAGDAVCVASSPEEVARQARVVVTILPDSADVLEVVLGTRGLIEEVTPDHLLVDMSTIAPAATREMHTALAERGAACLDAPVSGGETGAREGTLSIMVGGDEKDVQRAMPLFEAMGKTIVHVGASGAGQTVKACNQVVVAIAYAGLSEALVLGRKAGVSPDKILQVLGGGLAASRVLDLRGPTMIAGDFTPGFRVDLHRKDLGIALETGRQVGVPLEVTALVSDLYDAAAAAGRGDQDHSALITVIDALAGDGQSRTNTPEEYV